MLFDHADPSIFTVLTSPSETPGTANIDFVIFPERWLVAENTFRPPWYHMNVMSEFMGLVYGEYDAKPQGFVPGGFSLHNMMLPHGPDADAFEAASNVELKPNKLEGTMAFMFETRFPQRVTAYAAGVDERQDDYADYGRVLKKHFNPAAAVGTAEHAMARLDDTHDPTSPSWVASANGHADFPIAEPAPRRVHARRATRCRAAASRSATTSSTWRPPTRPACSPAMRAQAAELAVGPR